MDDRFDVLIVGGGPAGATLGALLAQRTPLAVGLVEKERFPREHIGESFSHRVIGVLEESGALPKVLDSPWCIKKYGGYYAWNPAAPSTTFFDHPGYEADGVLRWAIHVNRAEFDRILLEHAESVGVRVEQGVAASDIVRTSSGFEVRCSDGAVRKAQLVVEASGRPTPILSSERRGWLSRYRNVAVWNHFLGARPAQSLEGDWNIFRDDDLSAIGSFAFEEGWAWTIPVPRLVDGQITHTHSVGIVTSPEVIKNSSSKWLDPQGFLAGIRQVPLLSELLADARPIGASMKTATNYSMISGQMVDPQQRYLLIGDSAFFVDPLFSSGVAFALLQAASASTLIAATLVSAVGDTQRRQLWDDYERTWQTVARSFSLAIDQWYHAIAEHHPASTYWADERALPHFDVSEQTFRQLVDTDVAVPPDLAQVMWKGKRTVGDAQRIEEVERLQASDLPGPDVPIALSSGVVVESGLALGIGRSKGTYAPWENPGDNPAVAEFWKDPVEHGAALPSAFAEPIPCRYFFDPKSGQTIRARGTVEQTDALLAYLRSGEATLAGVHETFSGAQRKSVEELARAGLVVPT